jgi:SNF2 family DNA or RNA helicase/ubiquinone/menaquinone biosynthesis C-methylase UbiE
MKIEEHADSIIKEYENGIGPWKIAKQYCKTEEEDEKTEIAGEIVSLLRDKGYPVSWKMIGDGNLKEQLSLAEEKNERLFKENKRSEKKYNQMKVSIEKAKKVALMEGDWKDPAQRSNKIKNAEKLVEILNTDIKGRLAVKLCWGNDVDFADVIAVMYDGRITRDDAMKMTQEPSLKDYLGNFKMPTGIAEVLQPALEILPLDKNDVIKDIFSRRLVEYRRHKLGNKPDSYKKQEFLKEIEKLDLKKINDPEIEELVKKITPEEKEKIENAVEDCYSKIYSKTKELYSMHEKGISGLEKKVKNPLFGVNGNNCEEYCTDFLSFYQIEGVQMIIDRKKVLLSDEPGLGKTAQAIGAKIELENRLGRKVKTLVFCPTREVRISWEEKLKEYITPERRKTMKILNIEDYEKDLEKIDDADTVIVDYNAFSFNEKKPNNIKRKNLKKKLEEAGFELVIPDEVHNIKNYLSASRYENIKGIIDKAEYLALLSGTPAPCRLRDFYSLVSLLKPERIGKDGQKEGYKDAKEVARIHATSPGVIGAILRTNRLERKLLETQIMPELKEIPFYVEMNRVQKESYTSVFENEELTGPQKLQKLKQDLLNPKLLGEQIESCKFKAIEEIIEEKIAKNEKVVIYSPLFREGVLKVLENKYKHYGALRMDGTNKAKREDIRKLFQKNPENKILIATDVAGEGITLTAANNLICLDDPYSFGEKRQMVGRLWRPGQSKPVYVYSIIVKDSIDEGIQTFLKQKKIAIDYVEKGVKLTPEQERIMGGKGLIDQWLSIHAEYLYTPEQIIHRMTGRMAGKPEEAVEKALKGRFGKTYAKNYYIDWEKSFSGNVSQIYKRIIEGIEKKEKLEKKVDIASGAGMLSYVTGQKGIFNIEMNKYHFDEPKYASKENNNIESSMTKIPLGSEQYDFALCSLGLHILPNTKESPSREKALKEANRILNKGGYYMIALPGVQVTDRKKFESGIEKAGFKVIPELSGYVISKDEKINAFGYVMTARKVRESENNLYESITLLNDLKEKPKVRHQRRRGICTEFDFCDLYGKKAYSLDEGIKKYLGGGK